MLSDRALIVLNKRIFLRDNKGKVIENFTSMCNRVASFVGKDEEEKKAFYTLMHDLKFLPNSPCLTNAGVSGRPNQLSACFVLDIEDSIDSIYDTLKRAAIIHKTGGGTGFSFSKLRPKDSVVASTKGVASGPVSFMHTYDASTEAIKQGGTRRGANMGVLRIDHPDIIDFIHAKQDGKCLQNFNISVAITDEFMEAVFKNEEYDLVNPSNKERKAVKAREVFNKLVENAHKNGDPGVLFLDTIAKHNPLTGPENVISATNPCGEQPLSPNEACGLGSINLAAHVINDQLDFEDLKKTAEVATLFLNRMLERSDYPTPEIEAKVKASRKIGLGIMGLADVFIKLRIPYTSEEALNLNEAIINTILLAAVKTTHELGKKEGTFPLFDKYVIPKHIRDAIAELGIAPSEYSPANSALLTVAPTGTLSMIADCSSGIEPVFCFEQEEQRMDTTIVHLHPLYKAFKDKFPKVSLPAYFQEVKDIDINSHIEMQATCQKFVCSAVSKTINMPSSATRQDVEMAYKEAFLAGCKGITIYRDGSRDNQVLSSANKEVTYVQPEQRPKRLTGITHSIKTGYGDMLVTINYYKEKPFEVICQLGKSGGSEMAKSEAISRLVSIMLRCNIHPKTIIEQLENIVGAKSVFTEYGLVKSIPDALAKLMTHEILSKDITQKVTPKVKVSMASCPECGNQLIVEGTCETCTSCGYKSCGG